MLLRLIDSGRCDAYYNMAIDEAISIHVREDKTAITLRLYEWLNPTITVGSFQRLDQIDLMFCKKNGIPVVRRPTGGRAIFHFDEITYSFSSTNQEPFTGRLFQVYQKLGSVFCVAFKSIGIDVQMNLNKKTYNVTKTPLCFKSTSYGELTYGGKKVIGSAQKRWREGFLQQGTIPLSIDYLTMKQAFKGCDSSIFDFIGIRDILNDFSPDILKKSIVRAFEEYFNITFVHSLPSSEEIDLAQRLVEQKYRFLE